MRFSKIYLAKSCHIGLAVLNFLIASFTLLGISNHGFPDGHVTEFEAAVSTPLSVLAYSLIGMAGVVLYLNLCLQKPSRRAILLSVGLSMLLIFATLIAVPWYFGSYLGLDNGAGG